MKKHAGAIMSSGIIITVFVMAIFWWFFLPPLNIQSIAFWIWTLIGIVLLSITVYFLKMDWKCFLPMSSVLLIVLIFFFIIGTPIGFDSQTKFYPRLQVKTVEYEEAMQNTDFTQIPLNDLESTRKIGSQQLSSLNDMVSQYKVDERYTLINFNGSPYRVTPLEYDGFMKYISNQKNGIPGYIQVNATANQAEYVKFSDNNLENMQYSPSAYFLHDLKRHLRIQYPTKVFGEFNFEINEENNRPYWIIPCIQYTTGINGAPIIDEVIILDAITGESTLTSSKEIPTWVDRALDSNVVHDWIKCWGKYKGGLLNSWFSKKEVTKPSEGYNYITKNNDVYYFTGMTSAASDESNVGFVLVNMRTGEAEFFNQNASTEVAAKQAAEGQVQQYGYISSDPIIMSIEGNNTYFMTLKDGSNYTKMYALVSANDANKVSVTDAKEGIEKAIENFAGNLPKTSISVIEKNIIIEEMANAIINGTTNYFIKNSDNIYVAPVTLNPSRLTFAKPGDSLTLVIPEQVDSHTIDVQEVK